MAKLYDFALRTKCPVHNPINTTKNDTRRFTRLPRYGSRV